MKKSIALLAASLIVLSACTSPFGSKEESTEVKVDPSQTEENTEVTQDDSQAAAVALNEKESNCKDSGGTFKEGTCSCPELTYGNDNSPIFTYNESTGYCVDPDGIPGGILGTDGKGADL